MSSATDDGPRVWFAARVVGEVNVTGGTVAITDDGLVTFTSTTLTSPRVLGTVARFGRSVDSRGVAAVLDREGALWTTDGAAPIARRTDVPVDRVVDAGFVSPTTGVVVGGDGSVWRSNRGSHWTRVDLGIDRANGAALVGNRVALRTSQGWRALDPATGELASPRLGRGPERDSDLDAESDASVLQLLDDPLDTMSIGHGSELLDGVDRVFRISFGEDVGLDAIDLRTGDRLVRDDIGGLALSIDRWGDGFGLREGYRYCASLVRYRPGEAPQDLTLANWSCPGLDGLLDAWGSRHRYYRAMEVARHAVLSSDGVHAAAPGACTSPRQRALCALVPRPGVPDRWLSIPMRGVVTSVLTMHGREALVVVGRENTSSLEIVDVETRRTRAIELPSSFARLHRTGWRSGRLFEDGEAFAVASLEGPERSVAIIGMPREMHIVTLPDQALDADFVDPQYGVAAGSNAGRLWRTTDGGQTFRAIALPIDGDARSISLQPDWLDSHGGVECRDEWCLVQNRVLVGARGPIDVPDERVLAASSVDDADTLLALPPAQPWTDHAVASCRSRQRVARRAFDPTEHHNGGPGATFISGRGARGDLVVTLLAADTPRIALRWSGHDEHGPFAVDAADVVPDVAFASDTDANDHLVVATRVGALLSHCAGGFEPRAECVTLWARPGNGFVVVDRGARVEEAIATPGGGAGMILRRGFDEPAIVLEIDSAGRELQRFVDVAAGEIGVFRGESVLVVPSSRNPRRLEVRSLRGGAVVHELPAVAANLAPCSTPPASDVVRFASREQALITLGELAFQHDETHSVLEASATGTCIRSLDATGWWNPAPGVGMPVVPPSDLGSDSIHLDAERGGWAGASETVRHLDLRCTWRPRR